MPLDQARLRLIVATSVIIALAGGRGLAEDASDFYKGKTVTMIVANAAGGGNDLFGRLVSEFMEKKLGATFVVRNMPGAGGLIGCSYLYATKPNGLTIGTFSVALIYYQLTETHGGRYDLSKMSWIGKASSDSRVVVLSAKHSGKSFEEIRNSGEPLKMAAGSIGSANYTDMAVVAKVADLKVQIVTGYSGNTAELAMRRGEIDGGVASFGSAKPFVDAGHGQFLLTVSAKTGTVPRLIDYIKTPLAERMTTLIASMNEMLRVFAGPPGIASDLLELLRGAFKSAIQDEGYVAKLSKVQQPHDPEFGAVVAQRITDALNQPPEAIALLRQIAEEGRGQKPKLVKGEIVTVDDSIRTVSMKLDDGSIFRAKISSSRTVLKVAGREVQRDALAAGMKCNITAPSGSAEAQLIECR